MGKKWYFHQQGSSESVFLYSEDTPVKNPAHPEQLLGKLLTSCFLRSKDGVTVSNSLLLNVANIASSYV